MRFLVDECAGPSLARWLRDASHEVFSVYEEARGMSDSDILEKSRDEQRILITIDKDFGEKVYREGLAHRGIVLLRLQDERAASKIAAVDRLLRAHAHELPDRFVVVTERGIRFGR